MPPKPESEYDHMGRYWMEKSDCMTCHEFDQKTVGPSFQQIAKRYPNEKTSLQYLVRKVKEGGSGVWGSTIMNPHPNLAEREIKIMLDYILSLRMEADKEGSGSAKEKPVIVNKNIPLYKPDQKQIHENHR